MASTVTDLSTINGWAKEIAGDVQRLSLPKVAKATKRIKFNKKKKLGEALVYPVWLTAEGGFTHGSGTLNDAKTATSTQARLSGSVISLRSLIDHKTFTVHMSDRDSFGAYWPEYMVQAKRSFARRLETIVVYGGSHLANVTGAGTLSGTSTARTIVIPDGEFAPHTFLGAKNHQIDFYNGATLINQDDVVEITSYNPRTRTLVVSGDADDLTDLDTAWNSGSGSFQIYWKGQYGADAAGLYKIGSETGSVTYAGINHANNPDTWQGSQVAVGSVKFDWDKLNEGLEMAAGKGCECPLVVQVSLKTWGNLLTDIAGLRVFDSSYKVKEGEFGVESIKYHGVTGMPVVIEPSGFIKRGHAIAFPDTSDEDFADAIERVGSSDVSFLHPMNDNEMITKVTGTTYHEAFAFSDQCVKVNPRDLIVWTGIVPE